MDKIETIRSKFPDEVQNIPQVQKTEIRSKMNVFELIVKIMWSGLHSYKRVEKLFWHINSIITISMETSTFPQNVNESHVKPLLKKTSLPKSELKNYSPVSNLSFISKILEKIVANRLQAHIKNNHLSNPLQSAYRKDHSTEPAVLKVHNDIIIILHGSVLWLTDWLTDWLND